MAAIAAVPTGSPVDPCCCTDCCLYPASSFGTSYTADDLPLEIALSVEGSFDDEIMSRSLTSPYYTATIAGTDWRVTHDGATWVFEFYNTDTSAWEVYGIRDCLIDAPSGTTDPVVTSRVEDTFPGTLYASWHGDTATLTRTSLCAWEGTSDTEGATVLLQYAIEGDPYWGLRIIWPTAVSGFPNTPGTGGSTREPAPSGSGQSTPVGEFNNLGGFDYMPPEAAPGGVTISETP